MIKLIVMCRGTDRVGEDWYVQPTCITKVKAGRVAVYDEVLKKDTIRDCSIVTVEGEKLTVRETIENLVPEIERQMGQRFSFIELELPEYATSLKDSRSKKTDL